MGTVSWDGMRLEVVALPRPPGVRRTVAVFDYVAPRDARYDVVLRRAACGWRLRGPLPDGRLFAHVGPEGAQLIRLPTADRVIPLAKCRMHSHDVLTAIGEHWLYVMADSLEAWDAIALPEDMRVEDVSFDTARGLWLAGSEVRYRAPGSDRFQPCPPRLGLRAALRTVPRGGLDRLRTIDAESEWRVATSDSPRLLDDPSSFVFAWRDGGKWTASRLRGRLVRQVLPADGGVLIVTNDGAVYSIGGDGRLVELSSGERLREVFTPEFADPQPRLTIRDASAGRGILAVVAGLSRVVDGRLSWLATAVCVSEDHGLTWSIRDRTNPAAGEPELLTVAA